MPGECQTNPIRVLCVDDNPDVATLLHLSVAGEPDMESLGYICDINQVIPKVESCKPDIVILDLTMPGGDTLDVVRRLVAAQPDTRIIIFSGYDDTDSQDQAWQAGAWGFLSKHSEIAQVIAAVRNVAKGQTALGVKE